MTEAGNLLNEVCQFTYNVNILMTLYTNGTSALGNRTLNLHKCRSVDPHLFSTPRAIGSRSLSNSMEDVQTSNFRNQQK